MLVNHVSEYSQVVFDVASDYNSQDRNLIAVIVLNINTQHINVSDSVKDIVVSKLDEAYYSIDDSYIKYLKKEIRDMYHLNVAYIKQVSKDIQLQYDMHDFYVAEDRYAIALSDNTNVLKAVEHKNLLNVHRKIQRIKSSTFIKHDEQYRDNAVVQLRKFFKLSKDMQHCTDEEVAIATEVVQYVEQYRVSQLSIDDVHIEQDRIHYLAKL